MKVNKVIISTKGFNQYKFSVEDREWFDINEIFSKEELLKCIKECVEFEG